MRFFTVLSLLAAAATGVFAVEPITELKIDVTHLPADCTVKAQAGDAIKVHYVRGSITIM